MAFRALREIPDVTLKYAVIGNSQTIQVGDAIIPGATTHAAAVIGASNTTGNILGVVVGIVGIGGKVLELNTVTTASNNETVIKTSAVYIPAYIPCEYEAQLSQAAGTTTNSDLMQMFTMSTSDNGKLDETSTGVFSTNLQFFSYGKTTYDSSKVIGHWVKAI